MIVEAIIVYLNDKKFVYQLIVTLSTFLCIKIGYFFKQRRKRYQLFKHYGIPGPEPSLLAGNMWEEIEGRRVFLKHQEFTERYGDTWGMFIGDEPLMVTTKLEQLRKIFFEETKIFNKRSKVFLEGPVSNSILFADYNKWKIMRKVMAPPFNSYTMRGSKPTQFIEDSISLMTQYIDQKLKLAKLEKRKSNIDMHDLMKATALNLISGLAIKLPNTQVKENEENVVNLDSFLSESDKGVILFAIMFPFVTPILQFLYDHVEYSKTMGAIKKKVNKTIDDELKRLRNNQGLDTHNADKQLVDILIKLHYENKLTRNEIIGNVEALLIAGYDTTSTTLTYIFWVLGKYPEIQQKLRDDLLINGCDSKYLDMVIKETMRLYPTVMLFTQRLASRTVKIDDQLTIPAGTKVCYSAWLIHKNPKIWPEPEKFDPERFREGVEIHPCAYAPFGLGEKKCLGYQLAMLEMKMVACDILIRYKINVISPQNLELVSYAIVLSKPSEKVVLELEELSQGFIDTNQTVTN